MTQPEPRTRNLTERGEAALAEMIALFEERYKQQEASDAAAERERARQRAAEREPVSGQEPAEK